MLNQGHQNVWKWVGCGLPISSHTTCEITNLLKLPSVMLLTMNNNYLCQDNNHLNDSSQ